VDGRAPFAQVTERLRAAAIEISDVAAELRSAAESIADDPERLATVRDRRKRLHDLRRKYGETLADVLAFRDEVEGRVGELEARDSTAAALEAERDHARHVLAAEEREVGRARRAAAPELAAAVEAHLGSLALEKARIEVDVGEADPGDDVVFRLAANPGSPPLPLARIASGGELARTMLALRLVLSEAPETLVFDEVDAGVGGAAATAVGRALADIASDHQVLVVTHLPQVAAFARHQLTVSKEARGNQTSVSVRPATGDERVVELARMLSGSPDSAKARAHARELLATGGSPS
jgi:DNA repair protein RecN (Recombination protein N)